MDSALLAFFETGCASPSTASVPEVVSTLRFVCGRYIASAITAPFSPYPSIGVFYASPGSTLPYGALHACARFGIKWRYSDLQHITTSFACAIVCVLHKRDTQS